jgi:hypothetical protein
MSSGCFHPKNFALVGLTHLRFGTQDLLLLPTLCPAVQGTKNPSADLINFNSASRTFVNSRSLYQDRAGCQKLFFFFLPVLLTRNLN